MTARDEDRRAFVRRAVGALGLAAGVRTAGVVGTSVSRDAAHAEALWDEIPELPPEVTPVGKFYTVSKNVFDPTVDAQRWRLAITGKVERPYSLTLDQLRQLPAVTKPHT